MPWSKYRNPYWLDHPLPQGNNESLKPLAHIDLDEQQEQWNFTAIMVVSVRFKKKLPLIKKGRLWNWKNKRTKKPTSISHLILAILWRCAFSADDQTEGVHLSAHDSPAIDSTLQRFHPKGDKPKKHNLPLEKKETWNFFAWYKLSKALD